MKATCGVVEVRSSCGLSEDISIHSSGTTVHSSTTPSRTFEPIRPPFIFASPRFFSTRMNRFASRIETASIDRPIAAA